MSHIIVLLLCNIFEFVIKTFYHVTSILLASENKLMVGLADDKQCKLNTFIKI